MTPAAVVSVRDVVKVHGGGVDEVRALRGVSMEVGRGEFVSLVGPSGCGKSTLLNLIGCLDRPTEGAVLIDGEDVAGLSDDSLASMRNRRIGFVFQFHNLLPRLTALANVELPMLYARVPRAERTRRAMRELERLGLEARATHLPAELSGGERQRVAIARALVLQPSIILADEPTGNLDTARGSEIVSILRDLATAGTSVLMVTHDRELAERADRVVAMRDGVLVS